MNSLQYEELLNEWRKESLVEKYNEELKIFKKHLDNLDWPKLTIMKNAREQKRVRDMVEDIFEDIEL